jgi:hypothetical protein
MSSYTVTRSAGGHVFSLYRGRLRHRAKDTFDRAEATDATVTLTEHRTEEPRRVLDQKGPEFMWTEGRCPCVCQAHGKTWCSCPCPRHPHATGLA